MFWLEAENVLCVLYKTHRVYNITAEQKQICVLYIILLYIIM